MSTARPFWYEMRVQYNHTDAQGRVFYGRYFPILDQARCAFWESLSLTADEVRQIEHDTVIVHLEADYHGPAAFYDVLRIAVSIDKIGRSSLHLSYRVTQASGGQDVVTARMVMVQVDLRTETSRPWSAAFRQAIDHAAQAHTGG